MFLTKIRNWFRNKQDTLDILKSMETDITNLNNTIESESWKYLDKIEVLQQNKVYYMVVKEPEDVKRVQSMVKQLESSIQWTLPPIFVSNFPFDKLSDKQIKDLKIQWRKPK